MKRIHELYSCGLEKPFLKSDYFDEPVSSMWPKMCTIWCKNKLSSPFIVLKHRRRIFHDKIAWGEKGSGDGVWKEFIILILILYLRLYHCCHCMIFDWLQIANLRNVLDVMKILWKCHMDGKFDVDISVYVSWTKVVLRQGRIRNYKNI